MWASRHAQPIPAGSTHTTCCPKCLLPSSRSYSTNAKTARPALTCLSATNLQRRQPHLLSVAASSGVQLEGAPGTSCSTSSEVDSKHSGQIQGQLEAGLQQIIRDLRPEVGGLEPGQPSNSDGGGKDDAAVSSSGSRHLEEAVVPNGEDLTEPKYKTVMLKVSGEALMGPHGFGVDPEVLASVAEEVAAAAQAGVRIAIVVGGGNFFRGAQSLAGLERATGDYVGMLATVMNALCLQSALEKMGVETRVQTAIEMREVAEPYIRRRAISHLRESRVVIFGAGTGNPFFTTDTAAALRAAEVNAEVFLKATKVDGVYDSDPFKNPNARRYDQLSYRQVCVDNLNVMDETAITLCKENNIPVIVFNIMEKGNIRKAVLGQPVGTVVSAISSSQLQIATPPSSLPESEASGSPFVAAAAAAAALPGSSQPSPAAAAIDGSGAGHGLSVGGPDLGASIAAFRASLGESLGEPTSVEGEASSSGSA